MKYNKIIIPILLIILIVILVSVFIKPPQRIFNSQTNNHLSVVASFYPLYFFASQIAGDKAQIINITPAGAEPHDYEPSTQDIVHIEKASILILNGGQLEAWGDKIKEDLQGKNTEIVIAADGIVTQDIQQEGQLLKDPHVWLDPILAKEESKKILAAFIKVDPSNSLIYQDNEKKLEDRFNSLDQSFKSELHHCQQKNIITSHAAFGYIASRYGFNQISISGLSPDQEPTPQQLVKVARLAKENHIKHIFFETLISPKLSETIANEIGAQTLVFNPLEGLTKDEELAGQDYFSIQNNNLSNLKIALACQ